MSEIKFNAIAAMCDSNRGIGKNNELPWSLPNEYGYFLKVVQRTKDKSKVNALLVGRLTWLSIPLNSVPIKPCLNIIISSQMKREEIKTFDQNDADQVLICRSVDEAIKLVKEKYSDLIETIYSIGGTNIYRVSIESNEFERFYLTRVLENFECDVYMEPENFLSFFRKLDSSELEEEEKLYDCEYNKLITEPSNGVRYIFEVYEKIKN